MTCIHRTRALILQSKMIYRFQTSLLIHFHRMQCPSPLNVSSVDLWPSVILVQRLWSVCCSYPVERCNRFLSGCPQESRRMAVWTLFWSFRRLSMVFHILGWDSQRVIGTSYSRIHICCLFWIPHRGLYCERSTVREGIMVLCDAFSWEESHHHTHQTNPIMFLRELVSWHDLSYGFKIVFTISVIYSCL